MGNQSKWHYVLCQFPDVYDVMVRRATDVARRRRLLNFRGAMLQKETQAWVIIAVRNNVCHYFKILIQ